MLKGLRMANDVEKEEIYSAIKSLFVDEGTESINQDIIQFATQSVPAEYEMNADTCLFSGFLPEIEEPREEIRDDELQRYIAFKFEKVFSNFTSF